MNFPEPNSTYVHKRTGTACVVEECVDSVIDSVFQENGVVLYITEDGTRLAQRLRYFMTMFEEGRESEAPAWRRQEAAEGPKGLDSAEAAKAGLPAGRGESEGEERRPGKATVGIGIGAEGTECPELLTAARARELAQTARQAQADEERRRVLGVVLGAVEGAARRGERAWQVVWEEVCPGGPWMPTLVRMELSRLGFAVEALEGAPDLGLCVRW